MPIKASEVSSCKYLRMLILGAPKSGKTTTTLMTCEKPAYVINCDDEHSLRPATRHTTDFTCDHVTSGDVFQKLENALGEARKGVKEGRYKTIVWDTLTMYAWRIEQILNAQIPDGRRMWPEYEKRLRNVIDRLLMLNAHVIILAHYIDTGGEGGDNQMAKRGPGIVPLVGGKAKATLPALLNDVVFFEKKKTGRVFTLSIDGVFGPGCRSLEGVTEIPADIMGFYRLANKATPKTK